MVRAAIVFLSMGASLGLSSAELRPATGSLPATAPCGVLDSPAVVGDPAGQAVPNSTSASTSAAASAELPVSGVSDNGLRLIKAAEGFIATPGWDRTQWRVGYGTLADDPHQPMTEARASDVLKQRVASISGRIIAASRVPLRQDHLDALTSLAYNIGESALLGHGKGQPSTLWKKLQAGDFAGAADQFQRWNKVGGVTVPGLTKRRQWEAELFRRGNRQQD